MILALELGIRQGRILTSILKSPADAAGSSPTKPVDNLGTDLVLLRPATHLRAYAALREAEVPLRLSPEFQFERVSKISAGSVFIALKGDHSARLVKVTLAEDPEEHFAVSIGPHFADRTVPRLCGSGDLRDAACFIDPGNIWVEVDWQSYAEKRDPEPGDVLVEVGSHSAYLVVDGPSSMHGFLDLGSAALTWKRPTGASTFTKYALVSVEPDGQKLVSLSLETL